jgi:tetratricopeptide (TPR) repeat protein
MFLSEAGCRSTEYETLCRIILIITQKSHIWQSWPLVLQALKISSAQSNDMLNYLFKVSRDFMGSELVRELLLLSLDSDQTFKVYERLESELNSYPLIEDGDIQGFAGILCMFESVKNQSYKVSLLSKAEAHLKKALQLSPLMIYQYYYIDVISVTKPDSLKEYLQDSYRHNPQDIVIARNLFLAYTLDNTDHDHKWIDIAEQILFLNPVEAYTQSLSMLVNYYETRDVKRAINYLVNRLDYNSGEIWMWKKLISLLKDETFDFKDRADWWPQMHFNPISSTLNWDHEKTVVVLTIACFYISPATFLDSIMYIKVQSCKPFSSSCEKKLKKHFGADFDLIK